MGRTLMLDVIPIGSASLEPASTPSFPPVAAAGRCTAPSGSGRSELAGRRIWNVNSTARGGGVAEMLGPLLAYARGAGVDARGR